MPCNHKCAKWKAKKPPGGKRYESGQIRCDTCQIFMYPSLEYTHNTKTKKPDDSPEHGLSCNCCRMRISGRSYSAKFSKYQNPNEFPFQVGEFYIQKDITEKLKLSFSGGIRPSDKNKLIVVFMNAHDPKSTVIDDPFGRVNIYHDFYDHSTGLYHYTGAGQLGNQKLSGRNLSVVKAKEMNRKIHFFRQYGVGLKHQYIGEVEVVDRDTEIQKDAKNKNRKVIIFYLKPKSKIIISEEDAISREIESEINIKKTKRTKSEIQKDIEKLNKTIKKSGPAKGRVYRNEIENKRHKGIVKYLKELYEKCMVCNIMHFEKENGVPYSEVHHLISWAESYDDSRENLVVLCPTCHKKLDHAKSSTKLAMYQKLCKNYPKIHFNKLNYS